MPNLLLKDLPRYECLLEAAQRYPELDPSACEVFLHLLRAGDEASLHTEQTFACHGISQGRFGVMMQLLAPAGECSGPIGLTPAELADRTGVTRATITGLVDTLERDGYVSRAVDAHDRRMQRVCLTQKARDLMRQILPEHFQRMASLMAPLDETERRNLVALLNKVLQHASTLNAPEVAAPAALTH